MKRKENFKLTLEFENGLEWTREEARTFLTSHFGGLVTVGGCHVALHDQNKKRILIATTNGEDWK